MACNNLNTTGGAASAVIGAANNSKQYGMTDQAVEITAITVQTVWDALALPGLSGTVVINPSSLPASTAVVINGANTTQITNDIFARSIDPLQTLAISTTTSATTSLFASVIGTVFGN